VRSRNRASDSRHRFNLNRIAAHDFLWRKINAAVHRLENVVSDLREVGSCFAGRFRFVNWLVFLAAGKNDNRACNEAASDSREAEKIVSGFPERLHRAIIDTLVESFLARKF